MKTLFSRFMKDESGVTAIEYGLIAALIGVVIIGAASVVGTELSAKFTTISTEIKNAGGPSTPAPTPDPGDETPGE